MGSADERPDLDALRELEEVLRGLSEELAAWRRRALTAESRLADEARAHDGSDGPTLRLRDLEEANQALQRRLDSARARVASLVSRLGFLEQQAMTSGGGGEMPR